MILPTSFPSFRSRQKHAAASFMAAMVQRGAVFAALLLLGEASKAQEGAVGVPPPIESDIRKIEGIFGSDLPTTERKGSVRLIVHPHFGDLTNRDYIRVLTGLRMGVTDHLELFTGVEPYIDHGLKRTSPGTGIGDVRFGGKYGLGESLIPGYETSVGLNLFFPVGHPPVGMTNGRNEYSPYFVIGKRISSHPGLTLFRNTGVNFLQNTSIPGSFERNTPHSSSLSITPGIVYTRYPFHYTLELTYETTSLIGEGSQQFVTVRPGIAWDLPPKLKFHSKGRVTIAAGLHVTFGPDGTSTGGGGKLRAEFGISRWFRRDAKDTGLPETRRDSSLRR
ncbi:MAG: transporter [Opitutus sp.]